MDSPFPPGRSDGGTQEGRYERAYWTWSVSWCSHPLEVNPQRLGEARTKISYWEIGVVDPPLPRKAPGRDDGVVPVPQTDTGR